MATKKDRKRMERVGKQEAHDALLDILGIEEMCEIAQLIKLVRVRIGCRKKKSSEDVMEYLHIIGAGVALGHVKLKAANKTKFYGSWEWKKARYEAIKKYEQRCMCCGWRVGDTEHGYLVVDHIKPRSKFPELSLDVSNLQILCNDCNMGKSNDSIDDWREMDDQFKAVVG